MYRGGPQVTIATKDNHSDLVKQALEHGEVLQKIEQERRSERMTRLSQMGQQVQQVQPTLQTPPTPLNQSEISQHYLNQTTLRQSRGAQIHPMYTKTVEKMVELEEPKRVELEEPKRIKLEEPIGVNFDDDEDGFRSHLGKWYGPWKPIGDDEQPLRYRVDKKTHLVTLEIPFIEARDAEVSNYIMIGNPLPTWARPENSIITLTMVRYGDVFCTGVIMVSSEGEVTISVGADIDVFEEGQECGHPYCRIIQYIVK